ncbi:hypothetical protein D0T08_00945 [Emticicia sp. C21]|nr:hypothetical protein D0T08_00945 [Emticicia sp. C21]
MKASSKTGNLDDAHSGVIFYLITIAMNEEKETLSQRKLIAMIEVLMTIKVLLKKVTNSGNLFHLGANQSLFKRAIGLISSRNFTVFQNYSHENELKKVTNMVGTFTIEDCSGSMIKEQLAIYQQVIKIEATKRELKKVTNIVGTFLTKEHTRRLFKKAIGLLFSRNLGVC